MLYDGFRRWNAGADYALDRYSDGNASRTNIGADVTAHLFYEPTRLSVSYRWQNYAFSDRSGVLLAGIVHHPYVWSGVAAFPEWRRALPRRKRHLLQCGIPGESRTGQHFLSHHVEAGVYRDWNSRLSTSLQYQHTWNSKEAVYEDDRLSAQAQWHFR